jgi:hypothetical protein
LIKNETFSGASLFFVEHQKMWLTLGRQYVAVRTTSSVEEPFDAFIGKEFTLLGN